MNRKTLMVLPGTLLLAACVSGSPLAPEPIAGCKTLPEEACRINKENGKNVVTFNRVSLAVAPECIKVSRGDSFEVRIVPPPAAAAEVITVPQDATDGWLIGSNGNPGAGGVDSIRITVPAGTALDKYQYLILSSGDGGGKCLDPRVHVDN